MAVAANATEQAIQVAKRRLLPVLLLMYVIAFLDRANIGFAKRALQTHAGISASAYALGAGLFFLTYALFEIPSNLLMRRVGARLWLCRIVVTWGLVSTATLFVRGPYSFYALRLLLGAAEAGLFPGILLYLTYWFPSRTRGSVLGIFYFGAPLALVVGGPISGSLLQLPPLLGLQGWQLMFLVEGLIAVAAAILIYAVLRDGPDDVSWLHPEQKALLTGALEEEAAWKRTDGLVAIAAMLRSPRMMYYALLYCLIQMSVYGVVFFLPSLVGTLLGSSMNAEVGLLSAVPWLCALAAAYWLPRAADRRGSHRLLGGSALLLSAAASLLFVSSHPALAMFGLCVAASGFIAVQPLFWTLPMNYLGGDAAAAGFALVNVAGALGSFVAPNLKVWADLHFQSHMAGLLLLGVFSAAGGVLLLLAPHDRSRALQRA
jgi:sugar phosphate permease